MGAEMTSRSDAPSNLADRLEAQARAEEYQPADVNELLLESAAALRSERDAPSRDAVLREVICGQGYVAARNVADGAESAMSINDTRIRAMALEFVALVRALQSAPLPVEQKDAAAQANVPELVAPIKPESSVPPAAAAPCVVVPELSDDLVHRLARRLFDWEIDNPVPREMAMRIRHAHAYLIAAAPRVDEGSLPK